MWANMTIVPWSKSKHDAELDGPYTFDVSQTDFFLDCRARPDDRFGDNVITLSTDYAYGWTVVKISDESGTAPSPWLDVSALHGAPFENGRLVIRTTMNTGSNIRTGYIYLSAGRWKYIVKVTQGGVL